MVFGVEQHQCVKLTVSFVEYHSYHFQCALNIYTTDNLVMQFWPHVTVADPETEERRLLCM